jgi:peptidoglycan/xylan/chitin deacetylase (PgdA/CDA1 family)/folate-dependent phosphoribosylglycinamide formyltransferase PurN
VARLIARLAAEAPEAHVAGVLFEQRRGRSLPRRVRAFLRSLRDPDFIPYVAHRVAGTAQDLLTRAADALIRIAHACPREPNGSTDMPIAELDRFCADRGIPFLATYDVHSTAALAFVRAQAADLGVVYGTGILKPSLFELPRLGSINIHQRKVPDYRGGGPIGLWELLDGQTEIGVTVHRVVQDVDAGAVLDTATIPIDDFDTLTSLALKAQVVGNDLLVSTIRRCAAGTAVEQPQREAGRVFRSPSPQALHRLVKRLRKVRPVAPSSPTRPHLKLLARSCLLLPYAVVRNRRHRRRQSFPVVILYHHLVADRPHADGITTDAYAAHVAYLRKHYRIASLEEAVAMLESGRVSAPTVVLTLDDGYADNFLGLRGIVEDTGVPVAMFVSTEQVRLQREFAHDVRVNQRGFLPLTEDQVVQMDRDGFEIGSHTRSHFDCGSTDEAALRREIVESRTDLESLLRKPQRFFAFPWGQPSNMSAAALRIASATYRYVLSAFGGHNTPDATRRWWHLRRCPHPNHLWELELQAQSLLELREPVVDVDATRRSWRRSSQARLAAAAVRPRPHAG